MQFTANALRTKLGCVVECARNGLDAASRLEDGAFDLVVSDVRMPHMNGVELLEWVRGHRPDLSERLLFMTGDGSGAGLNSAIRLAGRPLLRKPIAVGDLVRAAERILQESSMRVAE